MTDMTLFKPGNVPAHLRTTELSETTKALMGSAPSGRRISIKGCTFRFVVNGKEVHRLDERYMDVIIVRAAAKVGRQFYAKSYDADATAEAPDCWSQDGEKPDASSRHRQHDTCAGCPQNIAGSGRGESRACRYQQRLAVLDATDTDAGVYQLALPSTSLFGKEEGNDRPLQAYARYLASQTPPVNLDAIVTRMKFDTKVESPKLFFAPVRWLSPEEYAVAKEQADTPEAKQAVTMSVAQTDGAQAAPMKLEGARPDVQEKPKAKAVLNEEPTTTDEPEKRKPAAKADKSVPVKKDLADIVEKWDDQD